MEQGVAYVCGADGGMSPANAKQAALALELFAPGETYVLSELLPRDWNSHRHYFAALKQMWASLPEGFGDRWPTPEHLRKHALIATGWSVRRDYDCSGNADALAMAAFLEGIVDEYAIVRVKESTVAVWRAKSQSEIGMPNRKDFQRSKWDVLNWVADLLRLPPDDEHRSVN